jgi:hypothetical protein
MVDQLSSAVPAGTSQVGEKNLALSPEFTSQLRDSF